MATGTVKWFNDAKGFGFINGDDDIDVFVHYSAIEGSGHRSLSDGARVKYDVVTAPKGLQAQNVEVIR